MYKNTENDNNNNRIEEFFIINALNLGMNNKTYKCENLDLSRLDDIFEIDREN